ncbi:MAG: aminotransferase class III-fold pyridoxal phosphate-dependent enzyme, partial [Deltaproteobacteria bacterium]|nr:aminotransferase class III-fold pyridoxal phosphate-dependent enzyme [Deltaproteobacteria bacterium]
MSESMDEDRLREAFGRYFKPRLLSQLHAIGIDKIYHRGAGDSLFLRDEEGRETCVLDLLGGFGANLFGHNHPELVDRLRELLDAGRPFNAQASMRASAAELAERLSERIGRSTGREYVVTFANSGAEAVEAAVKHAELAATGRME